MQFFIASIVLEIVSISSQGETDKQRSIF